MSERRHDTFQLDDHPHGHGHDPRKRAADGGATDQRKRAAATAQPAAAPTPASGTDAATQPAAATAAATQPAAATTPATDTPAAVTFIVEPDRHITSELADLDLLPDAYDRFVDLALRTAADDTRITGGHTTFLQFPLHIPTGDAALAGLDEHALTEPPTLFPSSRISRWNALIVIARMIALAARDATNIDNVLPSGRTFTVPTHATHNRESPRGRSMRIMLLLPLLLPEVVTIANIQPGDRERQPAFRCSTNLIVNVTRPQAFGFHATVATDRVFRVRNGLVPAAGDIIEARANFTRAPIAFTVARVDLDTATFTVHEPLPDKLPSEQVQFYFQPQSAVQDLAERLAASRTLLLARIHTLRQRWAALNIELTP